MTQKVYVVVMRRFGDSELHSYAQGVFTKKHQAKKAGIAEEYFRGGKYEAVLYEFELDSHDKSSIDNLVNCCGGYNEQEAKHIKVINT